MRHGAQSVMMPGTPWMPMLHADSWDTQDTVCRAVFLCIKFTYNNSIDATAYSGGRFSSGAGPIFVDNSGCSGNENRLFDCPYDMHTADCTHAEDAGLRCSGRCEFLTFL